MLICGLPASGKSTLARRLAPAIPAIRLDKDGWVTQLGEDLWDDEFRIRLERQLWALTQELLARGQSVILEWGHWARSERDEKRLGRGHSVWVSNCTTSPLPWTSWSDGPIVARRRASGRPRRSRGLTSRSGHRCFNLPTRRSSGCSTRLSSTVDSVLPTSSGNQGMPSVPLGDARGQVQRPAGGLSRLGPMTVVGSVVSNSGGRGRDRRRDVPQRSGTGGRSRGTVDRTGVVRGGVRIEPDHAMVRSGEEPGWRP